jgi:chromosome segregation ATPase
MPEDNEKVEDFISLWRKKMETEMKKPSVIGDTLERIKDVEKENEDLRNKIKQNIDLLSRTEKVIKETIEENERLKEQLKQKPIGSSVANEIIKQENIKLKEKIKQIERLNLEKDEELNEKEREIAELIIESYSTQRQPEPTPSIVTDSESTVTNALIEELQSELSKKKLVITEFEKSNKTKDIKINELMEENKSLNEQLLEKLKSLPIDYVVPVETIKEPEIKSQSTQSPSTTLELLCQDLQSDLNRAKGIIKQLTEDKSELKQALEKGGFQLEPNEIKELKKENDDLRNEISKLQNSLKLKSEETKPAVIVDNFEDKVKDLQKQMKEKDTLITKLQMLKPDQKAIPGPMANLIEDLQNRINKLKLTLEEKNKIIEELKSS